MWWSALGPEAKVDRCLSSSSRSRARHCCPKVEDWKPLTSTKMSNSDQTHDHTVSQPPSPVFPRSRVG